MEGINIEMEQWQAELLRPLLDLAVEENAKGKPGAVFAQLWECEDGAVVAEARFVNRKACAAIQEATGMQGAPEKGKRDIYAVFRPDLALSK